MAVRSDYVEHVPATAEDVLTVFRNWRHVWGQEADRTDDAGLTPSTPLARCEEFVEGLEFDLPDLADGLNEYFAIDRSEEEWRRVLVPPGGATVGDLCRFIAETAKLPRVKPARIAGAECRPAGAFLAIRDLLGDEGDIGPSTRISDYALRRRRTFEKVLVEAVRVAAVPLPPLTIVRSPLGTLLSILGLSGLLVALLSYANADDDRSTALVAAVSLGALLAGGIVWLRPREIRFGDLVTFRDLAVHLAAHAAPPHPVSRLP